MRRRRAVLALGLALAGGPLPAGAEASGDGDLRIVPAAVSDAANGYLRLEEAAREVHLSPGDRRRLGAPSGGPDEAEFADRILAANAPALDRLGEAARSERFASGRIRYLGPEVEAWATLAKLAALRSAARARAGDAEGALGDALAMIAVGRGVADDPHCALWCAVAGFSMKHAGAAAIARALPTSAPTPERSRELARTLALLASDNAGWRNIWAVEYQRMKADFSVANASEMRALAEAAAGFRAIRAIVGAPCSSWLAPAGHRGAVRDRVLRVGAVDFDRFELRRCLSDTELAVAATLTALRAYQVEHAGVLPDALDALVPRYLEAVPRDVFDGMPLRYERERRTLRSVGSDLAIGPDPREAIHPDFAEPVFPIPF
jgi:hypothetical protein